MSQIRLIFHLRKRDATAPPPERVFLLPATEPRPDFERLSRAITTFEHIYFITCEPLKCMGCGRMCKLNPTSATVMAPGPLLVQYHDADMDGCVVTARHEICAVCARRRCIMEVGVLVTTIDKEERALAAANVGGKEHIGRITQCAGCQRKSSPLEATFKVCSGCRCFRYCSHECQLKDWPTHKIVCGLVGKQI